MGLNRDDWPYDLARMAGTNAQHPGSVTPDTEGTVYDPGSPNDIYNKTYKGKNDTVYFYQQLRDATKNGASVQQQADIIRRLQHIVHTAYKTETENRMVTLNVPIQAQVIYRLKNKNTGAIVYKATNVSYSSYISEWDTPEEKAFKQEMNKHFAIRLSDDAVLKGGREYLENHKDALIHGYEDIAAYNARQAWGYYSPSDTLSDTYVRLDGSGRWRSKTSNERADAYVYDGVEGIGSLNWADSGQDADGWYSKYQFQSIMNDVLDQLYHANYDVSIYGGDTNYGLKMPQFLSDYMKELEDAARSADSASKQPRAALEKRLAGLF